MIHICVRAWHVWHVPVHAYEAFIYTCFQINVVPGTGYKFTVAVVVLFFFCGFDGSPTHKYIHRRLYPGDDPPPTCPTRRPKVAAAPPRGATLPQPHRDYEAWRSHDLGNSGQFQDI